MALLATPSSDEGAFRRCHGFEMKPGLTL